VRLRFLTSTPLDIRRGSGTYVGISVLARALEKLGHRIAIDTPRRSLPVYTLQRALFNRSLRHDPAVDLTVGFDMDGYTIAGPGRAHVASLKGVIADEVRFESGLTRLTMNWQAERERLHVARAQRVIATSHYSAGRARDLYGLTELPRVVPELIELAVWRRLLQTYPATPRTNHFTLLSVGRFYRRKRINLLLEAAAQLRGRLPRFSVRIVGNGPCADQWHALWRQHRLEGTVEWLGDISRSELAAEYNRCDAFCLPSVQEGFGIVLLEAMAAGKPVVAARAAAAPEVAPDALLVEPESAEALAAGIERLYRDPDLCASIKGVGLRRVEQFDARNVAQLFLGAVGDVANLKAAGQTA
jgi:glycosyltransferase involved in cell wall biosynthesis